MAQRVQANQWPLLNQSTAYKGYGKNCRMCIHSQGYVVPKRYRMGIKDTEV